MHMFQSKTGKKVKGYPSRNLACFTLRIYGTLDMQFLSTCLNQKYFGSILDDHGISMDCKHMSFVHGTGP